MVTVSRKRYKDKPWITKGLKISCKTSTKLYKIFITKPNTPAALRYPNYNRILKACIKKAENMYYSEIIQDKETTAKNLWKNLEAVINNKNKKKMSHDIEKLLYKGKYNFSDKDIANAMNDHFCSVGETLQTRLPACNNENFKTYLQSSLPNTFILSHVIFEEIFREIKLLDPKKAAGADGIGAKVIKLCPEIFAINLEKIFNHYIDRGEYPSEMRIARVIALHKKGEKMTLTTIDL